jgi:hypothetical protein
LSSSTSSSDPAPPSERRVWRRLLGAATLLVVVALALTEVVSRTVLVRSSKDLGRFRDYPRAARQLAETPALRIALVGNSAADRGIDAARLSGALGGRLGGRPVEARKFVADASRINDWYFILNRFFWRQQIAPDLTVVTFYEDDLQDGNRVEIGRMAQFFTGPADVPAVFDVDLPAFGDRAEFLISSAWMTYAVRSRVRERVMQALVPGYKPFIAGVNDVNMRRIAARSSGADGGEGAAPGAERARTHRALERLLVAARAHGSRLLFVAYPTAPIPENEHYRVAPETLELLTRSGAAFLDMRGRAPAIQARHYEDDVHLDHEGAALYTAALAEALAPLLPPPPPVPTPGLAPAGI